MDQNREKGTEPIFLHLDRHISRWNMHALILMLENNVLPLFSPSHTSMWGQANDNGTNLSLQNLLESIASTMRMDRSTAPVSYHNRIIFLTYKKYVVNEHNTLRATGTKCCKAFLPHHWPVSLQSYMYKLDRSYRNSRSKNIDRKQKL